MLFLVVGCTYARSPVLDLGAPVVGSGIGHIVAIRGGRAVMTTARRNLIVVSPSLAARVVNLRDANTRYIASDGISVWVSVYSLLTHEYEIVRINLKRGEIDQRTPLAIRAGADILAVDEKHRLWFTQPTISSIGRLTMDGKISEIRTTPLCLYPNFIVVTAKFIYMEHVNYQLCRYDRSKKTFSTLNTGVIFGSSMAPSTDSSVVIADFWHGAIIHVDSSGKMRRTFLPSGLRPYSVATHGRSTYFAIMRPDHPEIGVERDGVIHIIDVPFRPGELSINGESLWVSQFAGRRVVRLTLSRMEIAR